MPKCIKIRAKSRKLCSGDLNQSIIVQTRSIAAPDQDEVNFDEDFVNTSTVFAMVETTKGDEIFDGTNIIGVATHNFYIRFFANVTFENWVEFKGQKYKILDSENLDEKDEFYKLRCTKRGDTGFKVNLS